MKRNVWLALPVVVVAAIVGLSSIRTAKASDHDDGEADNKSRALNLTDLYAFREFDQNAGALATDLILVMNTNPRSIARQQYFFSTNARYEFHVSRKATVDHVADGSEDVTLRFEFGTPDVNNQQQITVTAIKDGTTTVGGTATTLTTSLALGATPVTNTVNLGGTNLAIFAGLREEPFFFDVESFFKTRASGTVQLKPSTTAVDGFAGFNVNSIVVRVPRAFLQSAALETVFDVWETISVRN